MTEIDDFPDHPFKVRDDEDMAQLIESIKERGVITPATVRQKEDGRYELISGHRRKRACELAGFDTLRCEVVELNRDEATILMVESNYQRSQILPSEKAYAYKMRLEALSRQGKRTDLTSDPLESSRVTVKPKFADIFALQTLFPNFWNMLMRGELKCDRRLNCLFSMRTVSVMWLMKST